MEIESKDLADNCHIGCFKQRGKLLIYIYNTSYESLHSATNIFFNTVSMINALTAVSYTNKLMKSAEHNSEEQHCCVEEDKRQLLIKIVL